MKKFLKRLLFWFLISLLFFIAYFVYVYNDLTSTSKGVPIAGYTEIKTAVLVIDIQEGYTGEHARTDHHTKQSQKLIDSTNRVITAAHEAGIPVIYIQQQTENRLINWLDGYHMADGSPAVDIDKRVKIVSLHQFRKRKSDAFSSHDLDRFLVEMKINNIIITGLDIAGCAFRTSVAALNRHYKVMVVEDAVISKSTELKDEKIMELKELGAEIITTKHISDLFARNATPGPQIL